MSKIDIRHPHSRPLPEARAAVDRMAGQIEEKFDVEHGWQGDSLFFRRAGVDGHIALSENEIHVTAQLGFLVAMMKGPIEAEIRRYLKDEFG